LADARQLTLRAVSPPRPDSSSDAAGAELGGRVEWFSGRLLK
jgi:hypothetical protein